MGVEQAADVVEVQVRQDDVVDGGGVDGERAERAAQPRVLVADRVDVALLVRPALTDPDVHERAVPGVPLEQHAARGHVDAVGVVGRVGA